jgi:hypothetical protein
MNTSSELLLPYGCPETGPLVSVAAAVRGVRYTCPGCASVLVLKDSPAKKRRKHFSHPSHGACSQESIFHATAKRLVAEAIRDHAGGKGDGIFIRMNCRSCTVPIEYPIPRDTFTDAKEEHSMDGYRCDVVGLKDSEVRLAIEIMHTHRTTEIKTAALSVKMVELESFDVLSDPCRWRPIRNTLKPRLCAKCKEIADRPVPPPVIRPTPQPAPRPVARPPVRPAPTPVPRVAPVPPPVAVPYNATRYFIRNTATLAPFAKELEQLLRGDLGRGNLRRGRRRF